MKHICQFIRPLLIILAFVLFVPLELSGAEPPGSINGWIAVQVAPSGAVGKKCRVVLIETEDQTRETSYPCATWFQPPVGRYLFWVENDMQISLQTVLRYGGEVFTGSGLMLTKATEPAGFIKFDTRGASTFDTTFRAISLNEVGRLRVFDRRLDRIAAERGVMVPVGTVIGGIFNAQGRALSLTKPTLVISRHTASLSPQSPSASASHVVAVLRRNTSEECTADLYVSGERLKSPAVSAQSGDRMVMAWYDIEAPTAARLEVICPDAKPFARDLKLVGGTIATVRAIIE